MNQIFKKYAWYIVGGFLLATFFTYQSVNNKLIVLEETVSSSWAQVENQLQRRYDLIPNLVESVKGYAKQEKEIFENIAEARSKLAGGGTRRDTLAASQQMESALSRLLVIAERYPNLKSNQNFQALMDELAGTENRLAVERKRYNEQVKIFNRTIRTFPYRYVAQRAGYEKIEYFQIEAAARSKPEVKF